MKQNLINAEILSRILKVRDQKVMLDRDLAVLYGVKTKVLKQSVRRNIERFPTDFMFELTKKEFDDWRSQFVTSNSDKMGLRYVPMVFTEQGIAMLSSVLKSERAIEVNIEIMRVFVRMREILMRDKDFSDKLDKLEKRIDKTDRNVGDIFTAIRQLRNSDPQPKKKIGFASKLKE